MRIVPVTSEHIPALSQLAADTFCETFAHLYPPEDLTAFLARSYAHEALTAEVFDVEQFWRIVLAEGDNAVAYLQAGPVKLPHAHADPVHHGEIKRLYVRQSHQGQGLGKQLMTAALDHLGERYGAAPQWIGVWSQNHKAQALYRSYGFEKAGDYLFPVGQTMDEEFILRRQPADNGPAATG